MNSSNTGTWPNKEKQEPNRNINVTYRPLLGGASRAVTVPPGRGEGGRGRGGFALEAGAGQEQGGDKEGLKGRSGSSRGHGGADSSGIHGGADSTGGHGGWASVTLSRFPGSATIAMEITPGGSGGRSGGVELVNTRGSGDEGGLDWTSGGEGDSGAKGELSGTDSGERIGAENSGVSAISRSSERHAGADNSGMSVCLSVYPSACLPACLPACLLARSSDWLSNRLFVCLIVCLSIRLTVCNHRWQVILSVKQRFFDTKRLWLSAPPQ